MNTELKKVASSAVPRMGFGLIQAAFFLSISP